ncbi:MAG: esterase [Gemmatimonadetes bacterium]|jgi:dienelactone hydrolase|nr:esterase [Gemmatimonadota bacterium]MCC6770871.1 esterase [Gemmatimonadaceae bacterium]
MMREHRIQTARSARVQSLGDVDGAQEVWLVIHGYGQLASDFIAPFDAIAGPGRAVLAPEALNRFYREREGGAGGHAGRPVGATWMTREDREADIADYVAYLDTVAAELARGRPLTVLGFSQGVSTLLRWVALGATPVQRVVAWAGELPADVDLLERRDRFSASGLDVVIGSVDEYATWINLDGLKRRLHAAAIPHRVHLFDGGHRLDRATLVTLAANR